MVNRGNQHHKAHVRSFSFLKIPLYLNWAGESANAVQVQEFCDQFSELVQQAVVDSPWVPGVFDYLSSHHAIQCFILITATPQEEIEQILDMLEIVQYFREVHGAPKTKTIVVNEVLGRLDCSQEQALIIGDSKTDLKAAEENNVDFLLRRTPFNKELQQQFQGYSVDNLNVIGQ